MKKIIIVVIVIIQEFSALMGQKSDTLMAQQYELKAEEYFKNFKYDSSTNLHIHAAKIYEKQKKWLSAIRNYRLAANSCLKDYKMDIALQYSQKALDLANTHFQNKKEEEISEKIDVFITHGEVYRYLVNPKKGLFYYEKALALLKKNDDQTALKSAMIWNKLGHIYSQLTQYEKAYNYCIKSLKKRQEILGDNHLDVAESYLYTGGILYTYFEKYDEALEYLNKSLSIYIQVLGENHPDVASCYSTIGYAYKYRGDILKNIEYQKKSLKVLSKIFGENYYLIYSSYVYIGYEYMDGLGDFEQGIEYFEKSLQILIKYNGEIHQSVFERYFSLGISYKENGIKDKALDYYQKALDIDSQLSKEKNIYLYDSLYIMGEIFHVKKNYLEALKCYQKLLNLNISIYGKVNNRVGNIYNQLAINYEQIQNYNRALEYYKKARDAWFSIYGEHHSVISYCYHMIGQCYAKNKNYLQALSFFQKALISNLNEFNDSNIYHNPQRILAIKKHDVLEILGNKAEALFLLYKYSDNNIRNIYASLDSYELYLKIIQELRNDYNYENSKLLLSEKTKNNFVNAINITLELDKTDTTKTYYNKAFGFMENSKSAALSAHLNNQEIKKQLNIPDSLLNKEKNIFINRRFYKTELAKKKANKERFDSLLVQDYQNKLFNYSRQYDTLIDLLKNNYPEYYILKFKGKYPEIEDIQVELDEDAALVNYFLGDTSLIICAIAKEKFEIKSMRIDSLFHQNVIDYYIDIKSSFTNNELVKSTYLYKNIIEPIEKVLINKDKLIIIPDGKLYYIPFETLCKSNSTISAPYYLIKDYSFSYQHSATLWLSNVQKDKGKKLTNNSFIGFAPVFDPNVNNGNILSNEWIQNTTEMESATRSVSKDLKHFNPLKYTEKEISSIVKLFEKHGDCAKGFLYKEASEEIFKQNVQNYNYIHIASHSFTNDSYPSLSGIAFSQPDTTAIDNKDEDGILYAGETYNLDLHNTNLIVLSSCKSGLGKLVKGEGFLSLSRGFIYSGASNIIFSLWNVKDKETKTLMVDFYKNILEGKDYATSLRKAKLKLLNNPKTALPKYWSGWVLVGN